MNISQSLTRFLKSGIKPTTDRERSALLDESRSFIEGLAAEVRAWTPPQTAQEVGDIEKAAKAHQAAKERAQHDLERRAQEQRQRLAGNPGKSLQDTLHQKLGKNRGPTASKPAASSTASKPAPAPARPLANEAVSSLTKMLRMSCFTAAEKAEAKRELDARRVTVGGKNGNISITSII